VFTIAAPAFDILFIGFVLNTKIVTVYNCWDIVLRRLQCLKPFIDLQMLQDATRRSWSSKATKQTRTRRCKTFKCCKMLLEDEGDETQPRGCKYTTQPCALAKILPKCAPSVVKSRTLRPLQTNFLLFQQIFFVLVCIHPGTPRVPPRLLASGPKPCGGKNNSDLWAGLYDSLIL